MRGRRLHLDDDVPIVTPTVQQTERPVDAVEAHMTMGKTEHMRVDGRSKRTVIELFGAPLSRFASI